MIAFIRGAVFTGIIGLSVMSPDHDLAIGLSALAIVVLLMQLWDELKLILRGDPASPGAGHGPTEK